MKTLVRPGKSSMLVMALMVMAFCLTFALPGCGEKKAEVPWSGLQPGEGEKMEATPPSPGVELLKNGDFYRQLNEWEVLNQGGSRVFGVNNLELVEGPGGSPAVRMTRTCDPNDGGASGLIQKMDNIHVTAGANLVLRAWVKCDMQNGGAIARTDTKWYPEGAVQFRIYYILEDGNKGEWFHGFYYGTVPRADNLRFTNIAQGEWYAYQSGNIAQEISAAHGGQAFNIYEFRVYGFGWDFDGSAARLSLSLEKT